jgi:hypothetical protein|tara:strand:- start:152 stop:385 length:234 start_codon:yes stop_codon:yes gene_type:complete
MYFNILTDTELMEAIVGGIGFYTMIWYFREYLKWSRIKSAGILFPLVWIIRKVGINLYKYIKETRKLQLKTLKVAKF